MMKKRSKVLLSFCVLLIAMLSMAIVSFAAEPTPKPGKVTGVKQVNADSSWIELDWDAQLIECDYQVDFSLDGVNWVTKDKAYNDSANIFDLNEATTYMVRITAYTEYYDDNVKDYVKVFGDPSDVISVATAPNGIANLKQTDATTNSITLEWDAVAGATGYFIYDGCLSSYSATPNLVATVNTNKAVIKNLKATNEYKFCIYAFRQAGNYTAISNRHEEIYDYNIKLVPGQVSAKTIEIMNYWSALGEFNVGWKEVARSDGYDIQVCEYNKKASTFKNTVTGNSAYVKKIKKNRFYKIRVRAYAEINGDKKYGGWSTYSYAAQETDVISARQVGSKKEAKIKWDTVKGATNYTVYMSTKKTSGYKKVGTTKKTNLTVKKIGKAKLKKNRTYYVYVIANRKVGKKIYTSGTPYCWEFKLTK